MDRISPSGRKIQPVGRWHPFRLLDNAFYNGAKAAGEIVGQCKVVPASGTAGTRCFVASQQSYMPPVFRTKSDKS